MRRIPRVLSRSFAVAASLAMALSSLASVAAAQAPSQASPPAPSKALNLYTTREPGLIQPLLDRFTRDTGIQVNTVFLRDGLLERVKAEGARSPADLLMTADSGQLIDLVLGGVTQGVKSKPLESAIPPHLRGRTGHWFALSLRDRVVYAERSLKLSGLRYEDLAKPEWKGRICVRSGQHPYNISLVAAMIAHQGEAKTEAWLRGVKANLARKATGGDRDVARDILAGICDIGLANAYYAGRMKAEPAGSEQRRWSDAIQVVRPVFAGGGTHVNISGASVARHAPNRANAVRLLEFLVSDEAQRVYAQANYESPVKKGVALDPIVAGFGPLKVDPLPLGDIVKHRARASVLVDRVGFDQ
ncbi:MAG: ABC transporter substrate-binding protein [Lysobacter sp.]|nr:ABC transporter substrate-binding protein [Lysobacter sp.]